MTQVLDQGGKKERRVWLKSLSASFISRVILILLALFLVGEVLAPSLAEAKGRPPLVDGDVVTDSSSLMEQIKSFAIKVKNWIMETELYKAIASAWDALGNLFDKGTKELRDQWAKFGQVYIATRQIEFEGEKRLTQAKIDAKTANVQLESAEKAMSQSPLPDSSEQFLCNSILTGQMVPYMIEFARIAERFVANSIEMRARCPQCDGNGPQYAAQEKFEREGKDITGEEIPGAPKTKNPLYNEKGADSDALPGVGYVDRDLTIDTISLDKIIELPPVKEGTINTESGPLTVSEPVPDTENPAQMAWVLAKSFCTRMAGPRITPPVRDETDSPEGKRARAKWESCAARQSAFITVCARRMARITRPNCSGDSEPEVRAFCNAAVRGCDAARSANIQLPPGYNDCSKGLSLHQAEYLNTVLCGSNRSSQARANTGANHADMMRSLAICSMVKMAFEARMEDEKKTLTTAVSAMQSMGDCFAGTGRK